MKENEFIKIWEDEGKTRSGFFNQENELVEEIPVEDTNSNNTEDLEAELDNAFDNDVRVI